MYLNYFGLDELPFSIAPNPDYLFLSDRHKEALAHLTHGLGDSGGFVLLTGEVGTGKTTVTRCMLESLPVTTKAAFIINPAVSELDLLASICDELKIDYDAQASLKVLMDKLRLRLIANHEKGFNTMLVIDEAQHLNAAVLEQLRLLTNLETNHRKLLQVILVGQPELQQVLKRNELRQLAQRITARYHLLPLTEAQVFAYIQHRLSVAGCKANLFEEAAIQYIHQITAGIPRLINLLCDRSLTGCFASNLPVVTLATVKQAATEILPLEANKGSKLLGNKWVMSGLVLAALGSGFAVSFVV